VSASVLLLTSDPPDARALGGVPVHVAALANGAAGEVTVHTAHPTGNELWVERWGPRHLAAVLPLDGAPSTASHDDSLELALVAAMVGTRADVLHVHSPLLGPRAMASAVRHASVHLAVTLHDHALACENYDLLEGGERFCDVPVDLARCDRCLGRTHRRPPGAVSRHRDAMRELVSIAAAFVAPSDSVLELVARVHPGILGRARRIDWGVPEPFVRSKRSATEPGPLSIAVVGALSAEKGRRRLPDLFSACRELDVTWHLFGATEGASTLDLRRSAPRIVLHGAYQRHALAGRLVAAGCHVALLPSTKPESFSLVLSEVIAAGLPVVASNVGALSERVSRQGLGWTFDPWAPETLSAVVGKLANNRSSVDDAASRVRALPHRTEAAMVRDHVALWTALGKSQRAARRDVGERAGAQWTRGTELAAIGGPAWPARLVARLRHTDFYRDLPLRRVLPESTRRMLEAASSTFLRRMRRR
jgi:glycosyltransferase involved in cell wall biosynthesis